MTSLVTPILKAVVEKRREGFWMVVMKFRRRVNIKYVVG